MTLFTSNYKSIVTALILLLNTVLQAQTNSINRTLADTASDQLNMDAVYNRPFLTFQKAPVALGGYLEANSIYSISDGVSEGLSFQARRLTIFMSSSINKRLKFLSEIEFEDGTKEIAIEFAALDLSFSPGLNFRGGIIMNPIGAFNQNHDGPKWEFIERPTVAVNMLPATWSNAGFGIYGKTYKGDWILGYEAYLSNGFDNSIIDNEENKTYLPSAKGNVERFEESNSGTVMFSAKAAIKNRKWGEVGLSYMGGSYNAFDVDGLQIDTERKVHVYAIDFNTTIASTGTYIVGEMAWINAEIPKTYTEQYGSNQRGVFVDVVQPILKRKILDWDNAVLNFSARFDYVDWNVGAFKSNGANIGEDIWAVTPSISLRPSMQTVFRINYRYDWQRDILANPAAKTATWLFGFSTYF
tara:strand:- start:438990 stop:440228 length:1239 start_codon:yes stop_codon:yes gene_type:complete